MRRTVSFGLLKAQIILMLAACLAHALADETPVYPQVRFQPLKNIVVLPSNEKLVELANKTEEEKPKTVEEKPDEKKVISMDELKKVDGSVTGSYHVLLENGKLQKVEYTAAPRVPVMEQINAEPEIRSWYYTQIPADVLQRYYAEYYSQQQKADYTKKPTSTTQGANTNAQGVSQSSNHGFNQASNHNVQLFQQDKKTAPVINGNFEQSTNQQNFQTSQTSSTQNSYRPGPSQSQGAAVLITTAQSQNQFSSQQRFRSADEVETFEPVQRRREGRVQSSQPPNDVVATIYYSDVSPVTGPVYAFDQTPLVRVLRQI